MSRNGVKEMTLIDTVEQQAAEAPKVETLPMRLTDGPMLPMIERLAAMPDFDVNKLEKLLWMQQQLWDREAKAAFNIAFAEMLAEIPTIIERKSTDKGKYAPREDIIDVVRPILARHGFSLSFRTEWPDKTTVKVVGILTHREGHSRESEFMSSADNTGSKNAIQALGSAVEYGRRYTTTDLLNIASGADDDARKAGKPEPPAGFDAYWKQLSDAADKGSTALEAAYACSQEEPYKTYRKYIANHNPAELAALKVKAKKAGR